MHWNQLYITLLFIVVNFGTQQYLVNYFYQASRNMFGLTGPLMKLYPKITFWYMNNYTMITYIDSDYIRFRFIKFPAMAIYSILIGGGITLAILRLQNWYVMKRKFKINPIQENGYNTQSKNLIILNVKGKFRFYHIFYSLTINLHLGLLISICLVLGIALMLIQFPQIIDLHKNYLLFYLPQITSSIVIPGLFFITHPKSFKNSTLEMSDLFLWILFELKYNPFWSFNIATVHQTSSFDWDSNFLVYFQLHIVQMWTLIFTTKYYYNMIFGISLAKNSFWYFFCDITKYLVFFAILLLEGQILLSIIKVNS